MKKLIDELAAYNTWANELMCNWLDIISDEQFKQEVVSSFSSIQKTTKHIWGAQEIWICRLENASFDRNIFISDSYSKDEIILNIKSSSLRLKKFADEISEMDLLKPLAYKNLKGEPFSNNIYQVLTHVFNHSTFHRGQVVTMLRQTGITEFDATDLVAFFRTLKE